MRRLSLSLVRRINSTFVVSTGSSRVSATRLKLGPKVFLRASGRQIGLLSNPWGRSNSTAGDGWLLGHEITDSAHLFIAADRPANSREFAHSSTRLSHSRRSCIGTWPCDGVACARAAAPSLVILRLRPNPNLSRFRHERRSDPLSLLTVSIHLLVEIGASELDLRQGASMHDRENPMPVGVGRDQKSALDLQGGLKTRKSCSARGGKDDQDAQNGSRLRSFGALAIVCRSIPVRALTWPQRPVKFIVPFGPGAGADIGARVLADKLQAKWEKPVVVENRPGGDSMVAITTFLNANDDHTFLFAPAGNFTVHPFIYSQLPYDPGELVPIARVSNTILAVAVNADSPFATIKDFTKAARAAPGKFNAAMVQGITEFTFWGYEHAEGLEIVQVPYRDINASTVDLGEGRIQIVMLSYAMMQAQAQAGRIRVLLVSNANRAPVLPDVPTARETGYSSLEVEGLVGLFGIKSIPDDLKRRSRRM